MTNVIDDPGFENGIADWECRQGIAVGITTWEHTDTHTGIGACRMTKQTTGTTTSFGVRQANTLYPTSEGQEWGISAWVFNDTDDTHDFRLQGWWQNATGNFTSISGPTSALPPRTWTQLQFNVTMPATAVKARMAVDSPNDLWNAGDSYVIDDVSFAATVTLTASVDTTKGYGWWIFDTATDPPAPGASYQLILHAGSDPFIGELDASGTDSRSGLLFLTAGEHTADVTVENILGTASAGYTVEQLLVSTTYLSDRLAQADVTWATSEGGPIALDAEIAWGDSVSESAAMTDLATGAFTLTHTYPPRGADHLYTITVTSGAQQATTDVLIPAGTLPTLTTMDGTASAVVEVQEWPTFTFDRSSSVLPIIGREDPVVLIDRVRLPSSEVVFLTRTQDDAGALLLVLKNRGPLILETPCPAVEDVWMIALSFTRERLTNRGDDFRRLWPTRFQEVPAP